MYFNCPPEGLRWPTASNQSLLLGSGPYASASYAYELTRLACDTDDLPVDGIELRIWVPDAEGRLWTAVTRFSAKYLVEELAFANFSGRFTVFDEASDELRALFDSPLLLEGVAYSSDDRFYRSFLIRGEQVQAIFKYSTLTFDVAVKDAGTPFQAWYGRLRQGGDFDADRPLSEIRHTESLPGLLFEMSGPGRMLDSMFPQLATLDLTDELGEPQETVRLG